MAFEGLGYKVVPVAEVCVGGVLSVHPLPSLCRRREAAEGLHPAGARKGQDAFANRDLCRDSLSRERGCFLLRGRISFSQESGKRVARWAELWDMLLGGQPAWSCSLTPGIPPGTRERNLAGVTAT